VTDFANEVFVVAYVNGENVKSRGKREAVDAEEGGT
jgi:hypothetical protein